MISPLKLSYKQPIIKIEVQVNTSWPYIVTHGTCDLIVNIVIYSTHKYWLLYHKQPRLRSKQEASVKFGKVFVVGCKLKHMIIDEYYRN